MENITARPFFSSHVNLFSVLSVWFDTNSMLNAGDDSDFNCTEFIACIFGLWKKDELSVNKWDLHIWRSICF